MAGIVAGDEAGMMLRYVGIAVEMPETGFAG